MPDIISWDGTLQGVHFVAVSWFARKPGEIVDVVDQDGNKLGRAECVRGKESWANGEKVYTTEFRMLDE